MTSDLSLYLDAVRDRLAKGYMLPINNPLDLERAMFDDLARLLALVEAGQRLNVGVEEFSVEVHKAIWYADTWGKTEFGLLKEKLAVLLTHYQAAVQEATRE